MLSTETTATITADPEVQAAINRVLERRRDPEVMRRAAERMDRMREDMRKRNGNVDLALPLIRETRDERWYRFSNKKAQEERPGLRRIDETSASGV